MQPHLPDTYEIYIAHVIIVKDPEVTNTKHFANKTGKKELTSPENQWDQNLKKNSLINYDLLAQQITKRNKYTATEMIFFNIEDVNTYLKSNYADNQVQIFAIEVPVSVIKRKSINDTQPRFIQEACIESNQIIGVIIRGGDGARNFVEKNPDYRSLPKPESELSKEYQIVSYYNSKYNREPSSFQKQYYRFFYTEDSNQNETYDPLSNDMKLINNNSVKK